MGKVRIALGQINPTVGDIAGNVRIILHHIERAKALKADIIAFPELAVSGYPPEDLLLKRKFTDDNMCALEELAQTVRDISVIVGFVEGGDGCVYNSSAIIEDGKVKGVYRKVHLPNYSVFDEKRYFTSGEMCNVFKKGDFTFGVNICEDIWVDDGPGMMQALVGGAQLLLNISSSPYHIRKPVLREDMLRKRAMDYCVYVAFCNLVGGQDELVFDGHSVVISPEGGVLARGRGFYEDLIVCDIDPASVIHKRGVRRTTDEVVDKIGDIRTVVLSEPEVDGKPSIDIELNELVGEEVEEVYGALVVGTHDYVVKNGFTDVVVGLSGGIDSALTTTIAVDALGAEHVHCVFMPSRFTRDISYEDVKKLVENLGVDLYEIEIDKAYDIYREMLANYFKGYEEDVTEENIQARIRGNILMALSNKFGWLVLAAGNKSEMSVGYCTLYGDMVGGFAVLKDVYKTLVWELARYKNRDSGREIIPERIIKRPPSAELKDDQYDTDSLPPYDVLDPILKAYIEEDEGVDAIVKMGYERDIVKRVIRLIDINEYKRRQSPIGIRITSRAFGKDRRMPITNHYREC